MEHGPFIDDLPIKYDDCPWLSLDVLNNQRVTITITISTGNFLSSISTPSIEGFSHPKTSIFPSISQGFMDFPKVLHGFSHPKHGFSHPKHGFSHPKPLFSHPKPLFPKIQSQWFQGLGFKTAVISGGFLPVAREAGIGEGAKDGGVSPENQQKWWS